VGVVVSFMQVEPHIKVCVDRIPEAELRNLVAEMLSRLAQLDGMDVLRSNYPLVAAHWEEPGRFNP
jgi:hypothetical protein